MGRRRTGTKFVGRLPQGDWTMMQAADGEIIFTSPALQPRIMRGGKLTILETGDNDGQENSDTEGSEG